jgi:predicted membrane protein
MDGARRNNNLGPHEYLINEIEKELRNDKKDHRIFQNNITQLKKLRGIADYEDVQIDSKKGDISIQLSDTVLKNLRANFKV